MELLHGENLESHIRSRGPLPPGIALEISKQLAEALAYAHSCGVIHRDLKPSNIILTREPFQSIRAVITDFGIASSVHELAEQQNEIVGTRAYMAPERFHGEVSPASDVFALGMIMYEMVTGERPSPDDLQQRTGPPRPISRSHAARYFKRAIVRCLNTDPELRFSDSQEVLDALTRASRIKQLLAMPSELYRRIFAKNKNRSARSATRTRCEWAVVLDGALELFDTVQRSQLELELRRLSGDQTLRVREVRRGSIILVLDGSEEGYRVISELFKSGQLRQILGLTVQDVSLQNTLGAGTLSAGEATPVSDMNTGCRVFISYSHKDARFVNKLVSHLSVMRKQGLIYAWYDRKIDAGREWKHLIDENLDSAQVVLLLVSPDFLASEYCYGIELNQALEKHNKGQARVVPVILRPSDWKSTVLADLQALPTDGKPISQWSDRDAAFDSVTQELRRIFEAMTRSGTRL